MMTTDARASWGVRIAFFLMVGADAFGHSFMPVFARGLYAADAAALPWLSDDVAAGLPVSAFWFMVAAAQLTTGQWERGRDHRVLFWIATGLATAGLALAAFSGGVIELVLWRGLSGFGYGAAMILTQDHLLRVMGPEARTRASGVYLSIFFAASIVGALAGGALAERIGFPITLLAAALVSALAMALTPLIGSHREAAAPEKMRVGPLLRNGPLMALVLFAAIPARLVNGAFVFYLVPLYLADLRVDQSTIARVVMIYALVLALTTGYWAALVDRTRRPVFFTILGVALSGLAMAIIPAGVSGMWGAVAAIATLGLAQAIGMSPQVTVLFRVAADEMERFGRTRLLGLYRVAERVGLFAGPMAAAWIVGGHGYVAAFAALAVMMALATITLLIIFVATGRSDSALSGAAPSDNAPCATSPNPRERTA